ncbi:hypothetical protein AM587_10017325 [Phytophthora nicotianae]|uniref:Uncharacterized protein n=1 Tax=Phytophthora nicotianae TaxID=4792 RepID=A0A0W8D9K8_PHYNI|nr:hypothetical protein AM587_10017325 [Phytophthora nicotianae]
MFGSTVLSYSLDSYDVGMPHKHFRTISYVHMVVACLNGGLLLLMVVGSLRRRNLVFYPWSQSIVKRPKKTLKNNAGAINYHVGNETSNQIMGKSTIQMLRRATATYANIANRRGAIGVNGRYFYIILVCREIVETTFQSVQAFRMSKYLSRSVLNRFYVSLLVINCWSSVFVHTRLFSNDEARRRLAAIVLDCTLDLMSAMGVSIMIIVNYVNEFDAELMSFSFELLEDNDWMAQMLDEARLVLVSSWSDLISRVVFALGIIATTASMKELLRWKPDRGNRITHAQGPNIADVKHRGTVEPIVSRQPAHTVMGANNDGTAEQPGSYKCLIPRNFWCYNAHLSNRTRRMIFIFVHCIFFAWGAVILALHVQASSKTPLVECSPKVYPMAGALPACFAVEFDCYKVGITGAKVDVIDQWKRFDHTTVVKLHILHCPELEVPEMFQEFIRLREIWIYNSTIRDWGPEAAVTNSCHPNLTVLSMIRTNLTDGLLPLGFQSDDFPINLTQINFCETNLRTLPDDIDGRWNFNASIHIENSQLSAIPLSLIRLQPISLSLTGNPINELPSKLFETPDIQYISVSYTDVVELPRNVAQPPLHPMVIDLAGTTIAFFWSWIDPFIENAIGDTLQIIAGGTPYCSDLATIFNGLVSNFSAVFHQGYSQYLMNASESNWNIIRQAIDCDTRTSVKFPLESWDAQYGMEFQC